MLCTDSAPVLTPQLLLMAYRGGFFPMADGEGRIQWHCPDPRAIFPLTDLRPNKRFLRFLRGSGLHCTTDAAFGDVMRQCATVHGDTWISEEMIGAYTALHHMGHAHSVEAWSGDELVGGLYGVRIGRAFFGESMFSLRTNAGKAAFYHIVDHLRANDYTLFDTQYINEHTRSLGAVEVPREAFRKMLAEAVG